MVTQAVVEVIPVVVLAVVLVVEIQELAEELTPRQVVVVEIQELVEELNPVEAEVVVTQQEVVTRQVVVEASHLEVAAVDQPPQAEAAQQSLPATAAES